MGYHHTDPRITADQWHVGRDSGIALFLAGTRTTKENGATRFVPGSHLQASAEGPGNEDEAVYAEMEKGDCLVMFTSLYHAGSPNLTEDEERIVYTKFSIRGTLLRVTVFFFFYFFLVLFLFLLFLFFPTANLYNNRWKINTFPSHLRKQHPGPTKSFPSSAMPSPTLS